MSQVFNIDCSELLSSAQNCEFWGDNINWRNTIDYSVKARFSTRSGEAYPLWSGLSGFGVMMTGNLFHFTTNGVSLGTGKVTSFSAEGGRDVSRKEFRIDFRVLASGDLGYFTGNILNVPLTGFAPYLNYLRSFSETINFSQDHNKTVGFERSLEIEFEKGYVDNFSTAETIRNTFFSSMADFGIYHPVQPGQFFTGGGVRQQSSQYDIANAKFSYGESYLYQSGLPYTWDYSHSLDQATNGISSLKENGTITSTKISPSGPRIEWANSGWNIVKTGISARLSGFYSRWSGEFGGTCSFGDPISKSITNNVFKGVVSYDYSYSTDATNYSGYFWSRQNEILKNQDGWIEISENGSINTKRYETGAMTELISYASGIWAAVGSRASGLYNSSIGFLKSLSCPSSGLSQNSLTEIYNEKSYTEIPASIDYSYNFSNDTSFFPTGLFRQVRTTYNDQKPVHLTNTFGIVNDQELIQGSNQSTLGILGTRVEIIGTTNLTIAQYYARATGEVKLPSGVYFISDENYSFDEFSRNFLFNRDYSYSTYRNLNDDLI